MTGVTPNNEMPEDVNTWSFLALKDPAFATSIDWDVTHLAVSAHGFSGVSFCSGDRSGGFGIMAASQDGLSDCDGDCLLRVVAHGCDVLVHPGGREGEPRLLHCQAQLAGEL